MTIQEKVSFIQQKTNTMLCIGLDTDVSKLPEGVSKDIKGVVDFNKRIIEATHEYCCSYKLNFAFYEQYGSAGFDAIEKTLLQVPKGHITIGDAKRGDIGNTSAAYANAILNQMGFDSITVAPYMGADSVEPFLSVDNKLVFVLALTSNPGSKDFQYVDVHGIPMYEHVINTSQQWKRMGELGYVVGATHPEQLQRVRGIVPLAPLLIPGVGTQGGNPEEIRIMNANGIAFINVSRAIIYASSKIDYPEIARTVAQKYCSQLYLTQ